MPLLRLALILYLLMLPVTGMVPVLHGLTEGRHPGTSDLARHLFMSINMIGALIAAPLAGLASDSLGRRVPLIAGALLVNAAALLLITGPWSYAVILALRFVEGCAHMTALSLLMTLGADHGRRAGLGASMGAVGSAISFGVASGAPLGGWIGAASATQVPWLGGWLMLALAAAVPLLLRETPRESARPSPTELVRQLASNRLLAVPYLFAFVDRLTVGFIVSTFSLYLGAVLLLDARQIGLVMAAFLIPFSLLAYPAGRLSQRWDRLGMMIAGSILYGLFLIALGWAPAGALAALMAAGGVVAAIMYAPSLVLTAELAGPNQRASTMAGFNVAGSLGFALGPLLGGTLVGTFRAAGMDPYLPVFILVGALEILIALAVLPLWRRGIGSALPTGRAGEASRTG
ncbi:MFS transporter [Pseudothauera nasutitermitis]|uniref:MFS transporter n=2 Tax=Pseudothauera nasutitermitis TaxID=2565930 RepID=A0A4S4B0S5_9RHOO|nr:MFS transporter [Pseudothauera nasutitermitis]